MCFAPLDILLSSIFEFLRSFLLSRRIFGLFLKKRCFRYGIALSLDAENCPFGQGNIMGVHVDVGNLEFLKISRNGFDRNLQKTLRKVDQQRCANISAWRFFGNSLIRERRIHRQDSLFGWWGSCLSQKSMHFANLRFERMRENREGEERTALLNSAKTWFSGRSMAFSM